VGYDPQLRRPRPRVTEDEVAPVDAILDEVADAPAPQWEAPAERPVAETLDVVAPEPVLELVADAGPEPIAELHEPPLDASDQVVQRVAPVAPIEPATPTPARAADWRVAAAAIAVVVALLTVWGWRRRRSH